MLRLCLQIYFQQNHFTDIAVYICLSRTQYFSLHQVTLYRKQISSEILHCIHETYLPMLGLISVLAVTLLLVFKVDTNNMSICSVFINNCSLTDSSLASSSKD